MAPSPAAGQADRGGFPTLHVGATFATGGGQQATIRGINGDEVWVDIQENGIHRGTLRFPRSAVEVALTDQSALPTPTHPPEPQPKQAAAPASRPQSQAPPTPNSPSSPPHSGRSADTPSPSPRRWGDLSPKLKFAIVGVPLGLALLGIVIAGNSRDERSYQLGRELSLVSTAGYKVGCGMGLCDKGNGGKVTPESQCRHWIQHDYGDDVESQNLVLKDMVAGCLAGFGD